MPTNRSAPSCARGSTRCCPPSRHNRRATPGPSAGNGTPTGSDALFDAGYAGLHWPREYGGRGASPTEQLIFYEEAARARAPYVGANFVGTLHAGPTLIEEGTDEQKAEHLPRILCGDEVWCQGFSEPGAGSDLASLRTRAERDGDDYILNGQKIWCSFGQIADVGEFLVRTDPEAPKNRGISWLILPMDLPGIEVRPLKTVLGSSEFAEVFLTDVRVPVANRVGAENDGWRVTNVTLKYERGTAFVSELVDSIRLAEDLASYRPIDAISRNIEVDLGRCIAEFDALWALTKRNVSQSTRGVTGPGAMVMKLAYSEARQRFGELCLRALHRDALHVDSNELVEERLRTLRAHHCGRARRRFNATSSASASSASPGAALMDLDLSDDQVALRDGIASMLAARVPIERRSRRLRSRTVRRARGPRACSRCAPTASRGPTAPSCSNSSAGTACRGRSFPHSCWATAASRAPRYWSRPVWIEHLDQLDVIVVVSGGKVHVIDPSAVDAERSSWPLDPCTPVARGRRPAGGNARRRGSVPVGSRGATLTAAFQLGLADRLTELAVEYAKERVQFDRPIGSFQAIKHMLADMLTRTEVRRAPPCTRGRGPRRGVGREHETPARPWRQGRRR